MTVALNSSDSSNGSNDTSTLGILMGEMKSAGVLDEPAAGEDPESAEESSEESTTPENEPENTEVVPGKEAKSSKPSKDVEEIFVTDESGRKKIKVDFSDREKMKRLVAKSYGADKFREERDRLKSQLEPIQAEHAELKKGWSELEGAFEQDGMRGIINLLMDDNQGYDKFIQTELAKVKRIEDASPEEKRQIELEERFERERKEREKLAKRLEDRDKQELTTREQAQQAQLKSLVEPAFNRYRFAGKLGDASVEQAYDKAVWSQTLEQLEQLPDNQEMSAALVDATFRKVAASFQKAVAQQVESKTKQVINRKKMDAQEKATATVSKASRTNVRDADLEADLRSGSFGGAFKNFFGVK